MLKEKIKELFNLEWIVEFTEKNRNSTDWIEDGYCILHVSTLISDNHGAYIPGLVLDMFGLAEGYDLENPYNWEKNDDIHETLMYYEECLTDAINELLPSVGEYYFGYHETDGSYCLFYRQDMYQDMEKYVYKETNQLFYYSPFGGYTMIYLFDNFGSTVPLCGVCADEMRKHELDDLPFCNVTTGSEIEESLSCDHCGDELCDYVEGKTLNSKTD